MKYDLEPRGWIVAEETFDPCRTAKCESIFAQGNGYMNLRNALEENYVGQRRGAFITGTFNKALPDEVTELPNLPDVTELRLTVNGERFSMETGTTENYCRKLDLRTGETERTLVWTSPAGASGAAPAAVRLAGPGASGRFLRRDHRPGRPGGPCAGKRHRQPGDQHRFPALHRG